MSQGLPGLWTADFQIRGKGDRKYWSQSDCNCNTYYCNHQFITYSVNKDTNLSKLQVMVREREARRAAARGVEKSRTQLGN